MDRMRLRDVADMRAVFDAIPAAAVVTGADQTIVAVNDALLRLTGWDRSELAGRPLAVLLPRASRCRRADGTTFAAEVQTSPILLDAGGLVVTTIRDETTWREKEADLFRRATHDELTGLANRALLVDRLGQALGHLAREGGEVAVLFVDLDRFKKVNDSRGHGAGDTLLRAVADALTAAVRPSDTVARVGGDEFVVVCEIDADGVPAREVADRLVAAVRAAAAKELGRADGLHVTASVGVAIATHPVDAGSLVDASDRAMYAAKRAGGDRVAYAVTN